MRSRSGSQRGSVAFHQRCGERLRAVEDARLCSLAIVRLVGRHPGILAEPQKAVGSLDEDGALRLHGRSGSPARQRCG
jgi:hypothetical protein